VVSNDRNVWLVLTGIIKFVVVVVDGNTNVIFNMICHKGLNFTNIITM